MLIYSYSPSLSQISFKKSSGKVFFFFFKIWPQSKWGEIKIGYFAAILKRYNILEFFGRIVIFYCQYIYGANFIAKFRLESGFLRGFHGPPLHQRE